MYYQIVNINTTVRNLKKLRNIFNYHVIIVKEKRTYRVKI